MSKISLFTIAFLISGLAFGQEIPQLKLTREGVEPIIVKADSLTASEIYKNALKWVQESYKNPDKVLKANIENKKIRIEGFASDAWWYKSLGIKQSYNMEYTIKISFKDDRYRFEHIIGKFYVDGGHKVLYGYKSFFKNSGEVRKVYKDAVPSLEQTMNDLSLSFYNYITGKTTEENDAW